MYFKDNFNFNYLDLNLFKWINFDMFQIKLIDLKSVQIYY